MNNMKKELDEINYEINKIKKRIELIELIEESSKYNGIESPFNVDRKYTLDFDLKNRELYFVFDDILDDLIENDFKIDFDINEFEEEINKKINNILNIDLNDPKLLKTRSLIGMMSDSYCCLRHHRDSTEVNILDMLLENKKIELILEIIVSDKVKISQKKYLLKQMMDKYPHLVSSLDNMPTLFYYTKECDGKKLFEDKFSQNLHSIFNDKNENIDIVRINLKGERKDEVTKSNRRDVIEFFINNKLVDVNEINWSYNDYDRINTAAASYVLGDHHLGKFIYSMKEYKKFDKKIRDDSDKVIFDILIDYHIYDLSELLQSPNYESSPEKFHYLINVLTKEYMNNPSDGLENMINKIVNILLRKTKKEDYKIIKECIKNLNINMDSELLEQKRKNLTSVLGKLNDSLIEQVPAKTKIKDIKFQKNESTIN